MKLNVPSDLGNPTVLLAFLDRVGLKLPATATVAAGAGMRLSAAGHKFAISDIDAVLGDHELEPVDRIHIKRELERHGLLEGPSGRRVLP